MTLTLDYFAQAKGFTPGELTVFGVRATKAGSVVIPYRDADGNEYIRYRIRKDAADGQGFAWNAGQAPLIPYGLQRPIPYTKAFAWIAEGESDCWSLWTHDIPALGVPGASNVGCLQAAHLAGLQSVAVVQEADEAGARFPTRVANRLWDLGFTGRISAVTMPAGCKDVRALMVADRASFRARLLQAYAQRTEIARPQLASPAAVGTHSLSLSDCFERVPEEVSWLVDGLLPCGGIGLLAARAKTGKSALARNLALSVARGRRFLGRNTAAGVVLWVALEEQDDQVISTFKAMGALPQDPLRFHFGQTPADVAAWLQAECVAHDIRLIIVDTWHKLTRIADINDYAMVNRANAPLRELARSTNATQLWLHHVNKGGAANGDEVLGSSALFAEADCLLSLRRANDGTRTIRSLQRVGQDLEDTVIAMDADTYLISSAGSKWAAQVEAARSAVESTLAAAGESMTREDVLRCTEGRRQINLAALGELVREGVAIRSGSGMRQDPSRYVLAVRREPDSDDRPATNLLDWSPNNDGAALVHID